MTSGNGGETSDGAKTSSRSLVVDEATFEEQFLRCQICQERFDQAKRAPKSLPCNHSFCLLCLQQVFDHGQPANRNSRWVSEEEADGTLKCPQCRVEIYLCRKEVKSLPNDHRVIQMIDFLSSAVAKTQSACTKHEGQPLNFFCKLCLNPVCRDCTVLDHKETQGHVIVDLADALRESSTEFDEFENKSKEIFTRMTSRSDALANASKQLDILEREMRNKIKDAFIEYRLLMERRQEAMVTNMQESVREQKAAINGRFAEVCKVSTQLQKTSDEFTKARSSNDIRHLFSLVQHMKDNEELYKQTSEGNDDNLFVTYSFEVESEAAFLSELLGIGEIKSRSCTDLKLPVPAHKLDILDREERQERLREMARLSAYETMMEDDLSVHDREDDADTGSFFLWNYIERGRERLDAEGGETESVPFPRIQVEGQRRPRRPGTGSLPTRDPHPPIYMTEALENDGARSNQDSRRPGSSRNSASRSRSRPPSSPQPIRIVRHPNTGVMPTTYAALAGRYEGEED